MPYPLISLVTRLPQTLEGLSPLAFRCRTFETFSLTFEADSEALDVFESIRELTVASKFPTPEPHNSSPLKPLLQLLSTNYTHLTISRIRLLTLRKAGTFITLERSLRAWALGHAPKHGDLLILTKITM